MRNGSDSLPPCIKVSECGTDMVNGLYKAMSKKVKYGALRYAHARYSNIQVRLPLSLRARVDDPDTDDAILDPPTAHERKDKNGKGMDHR